MIKRLQDLLETHGDVEIALKSTVFNIEPVTNINVIDLCQHIHGDHYLIPPVSGKVHRDQKKTCLINGYYSYTKAPKADDE